MESDRKALWIGALCVAAAAGAWVVLNRPRAASAPPAQVPTAPSTSAAPSEPLPKLEESDALVRRKAAGLSSSPAFAAWLKSDDLIARAAAALNMIADGKVPADSLAFLAPRGKFSVKRAGAALVLDPRSFSRYDPAADLVQSVDAAAAIRIFRDLKPLFEEAWRGLGEKSGDVQSVLGRAVSELLATPVLAGEIRLKASEKGIVYAFADDRLERLSPAQKQLLRMGSKNEVKIQGKLREIAAALGAP